MTDTTHSEDKSVTPRSARLARDAQGEPLGSAVFLDEDDLQALGIDPRATDADRVAYAVEDGVLWLDEADQ
ncbi:hypothetical protein [Halococcus saccharolyticus]|uniref:Uncharacterized protein n=1 Tax=Halococcus saccharolyticus DSM 5350 TaxID=1227455 RepID=M0MHU0_9EURY|nr:hypothetical protein [Halococcus saccharolyticus]EMA44279.1 hypothetical protein C449_12153 [Halococcus saccharolyticus DSM 5350]